MKYAIAIILILVPIVSHAQQPVSMIEDLHELHEQYRDDRNLQYASRSLVLDLLATSVAKVNAEHEYLSHDHWSTPMYEAEYDRILESTGLPDPGWQGYAGLQEVLAYDTGHVRGFYALTDSPGHAEIMRSDTMFSKGWGVAYDDDGWLVIAGLFLER